MTFGVIYVREAKSKPIISTKAKDTILRKSAVYYRYNSESTEIEPGDLENLIETEKRNLLELFVKKIEFIAQTGVEVATFFNIDDGKLYTPSPTNVIIDSDTLKDLKFIKEGEFTEKEGAPALVLKGTVENINVVDPIIIKTPSPTAILLNQVIEDFLHEKNVENPIEYLKTICNTGTANYPIYYYLKSIGISTDNVIKELQDLGGLVRRKTRDELIKRLSPDSKSYHYQSNAKGDVADMRRSYRRKILSQTLKYPIRMGEKRKQLEYLLQAIRSIDQKEIVKNKEYILKLLNEIYNTDILSCQKNDAAKTEFRKALCWVDEALYKLE